MEESGGSEEKEIPNSRASRNNPITVISRSGCISGKPFFVNLFEGDINLQIPDLTRNIHNVYISSSKTKKPIKSSKFQDTKECHGFTHNLYHIILNERSFNVLSKSNYWEYNRNNFVLVNKTIILIIWDRWSRIFNWRMSHAS